MRQVAVSVVSHGLEIFSLLLGACCPETKKLNDYLSVVCECQNIIRVCCLGQPFLTLSWLVETMVLKPTQQKLTSLTDLF